MIVAISVVSSGSTRTTVPSPLRTHRPGAGGEPRGVGGEPSGWQVSQPSVVLEVADCVLHDRVPTVIGLHLKQRPVAVGQDRVVAEHYVHRELAAGCRADAADDEPGGGLLLGAGERGAGGLGDVGAAVQPVRDRHPVVLGNGVDRPLDGPVLARRDAVAHAPHGGGTPRSPRRCRTRCPRVRSAGRWRRRGAPGRWSRR